MSVDECCFHITSMLLWRWINQLLDRTRYSVGIGQRWIQISFCCKFFLLPEAFVVVLQGYAPATMHIFNFRV